MEENNGKNNTSLFKKKYDSEIRTLLKGDDCNIQYGGVAESSVTTDVSSKSQGKCKRLFEMLASLTIEPVMFSFMFGYVMIMSVMSNMMMDKGCLYYFNYSSEVCSNLSAHETEKNNVEILSTNYSLYSNLLSFVAAFLMIFIAPWSDKYSRKLPLMMAVAGVLIGDVGYILCAYFFDSRLEYLILSKLPTELSGGFICVLTIMFSLASEQSSVENRTLKYTVLEIALGLGMSLGGLAGGFLYRYYGYLYVFTAVICFHVFAFVWILFVVEETRGLDVDKKWHEKAKDFFTCDSFKQNIAVTCKPRPGKTRALLLTLLFSMCLIVLNYEAFGSIAYVYVHHVYNWDPTTFSIVNTTSTLLSFVITLLLVPIFLRVLRINDFTLGIIGTVSMMAKNLFIAFSMHHTFLYYIGLCLGIFSSLSSLSVRAGISKLVEKDELGRVFSFLATCEAIIPMVGSIAVMKIFESTMNIFPNVTYSMTVVWLIVPLITFIWAKKSTKNSYNVLSEPVNEPIKEKP